MGSGFWFLAFFSVWAFGFFVNAFGFRVEGLGLGFGGFEGVLGLGLRVVDGLRLRVQFCTRSRA